MAGSDVTKKALAESIKKLMKKRPLRKISIKDIADGCGMNRQSFYYHFKDKYDLVNWIYYTEFVCKIRKKNLSLWDVLLNTCQYFYNNRVFYKNAFQEIGQNSFSEYFIEVLHPIITSNFNEIFKSNKNHDFYATFYEDAIRASISRWLIEETKISPEKYIELLIKAIEVAANQFQEEEYYI